MVSTHPCRERESDCSYFGFDVGDVIIVCLLVCVVLEEKNAVENTPAACGGV